VDSARVVRHLNAASVGGHPAAELQTRAVTWRIPAGPTLAYALPGAESGTYVATLHVLLDTTGTAGCELTGGLSDVNVFGVTRGALAMVSGGGTFTIRPADPAPHLTCSGATAIDDVTGPATVTLLRIDHSTRAQVAPVTRR
jgi:hypothetical protein